MSEFRERMPELELSPEMRVRGCNTLDELYAVLRDLKEVRGKERVFPAEEIIGYIKEVKLDHVTRSLGIRDTAKRIILHE
jgi:hypothetical protein